MKKIKAIASIAALGLTLSSCNDFLSLVPLNDIVLENFWTEKADVESVLLGTYAQLESSDAITKMSIWGEMRSDNIVGASSANNDILQITKDNILETNSNVSWKVFYDVINRANTVIYYAPIVADKDPNYSPDELKANVAEATALRALCYFYLIRAYKDVPYVTRPSKDDDEEFIVAASKFDDILDNIISDLESVKDDAVNKYAKEEANTSRITKCAINAMLADMYLWKGDWDKCISYAEAVLDRKIYEWEELKRKEGSDCVIELIKDMPLIPETVAGGDLGNAYNDIFGKGNSFESIFELAFMRNQSVSNSFVEDYYGSNSNQSGSLQPNDELMNNVAAGTNPVFTKYDARYVENINSQHITKYVNDNISFNLSTGTMTNRSASIRPSQNPANWIIYRLTDVMLMKAEAEVMKAKDQADVAVQDSLFKEAFKIVVGINNRSTNRVASGDTLKYTNYSSSIRTMEELVLLERRRELMFEGKRWFDLVRVARRDGDTKRLVAWIIPKHTENQSAIRIKLADMDAIYFPYLKDELKVNTLLKQNPAYEEDEYISKN
ncbi:MAG: RagB/SusD family nutrient uptake outer membrane protein [Bacteroidaceae bacterium]|nr:RagB/SusD family nutrient uptake outer membrane protein [Bacteroidaceae bacterium]